METDHEGTLVERTLSENSFTSSRLSLLETLVSLTKLTEQSETASQCAQPSDVFSSETADRTLLDALESLFKNRKDLQKPF